MGGEGRTMVEVNRRLFLGATGSLVAGQVLTSVTPALSAEEEVGIGVVGVGSRERATQDAVDDSRRGDSSDLR